MNWCDEHDRPEEACQEYHEIVQQRKDRWMKNNVENVAVAAMRVNQLFRDEWDRRNPTGDTGMDVALVYHQVALKLQLQLLEKGQA